MLVGMRRNCRGDYVVISVIYDIAPQLPVFALSGISV